MDKRFVNATGDDMVYDGKSPISWRISAYGILIYDDSIVLVKQKKTEKYQLPGGGVDLMETQAEALEREIYEETGLAGITVDTVVPFHTHENFFYKRTTGTYHHSLMLFYTHQLDALPESLTPALAEKISEVRLLPLREFREEEVQREHWLAIKHQFSK